MQRIYKIFEKAQSEKRILREDWEWLYEIAVTLNSDAALNGEKDMLYYLISLLEQGELNVDGISQDEILKRLSVFA